MFLQKKILYSYNDISILPSSCSNINSRKQCVVYKNQKLPIFTAPMSSVINVDNFEYFESLGINTILPRNIDFNTRLNYIKEGKWVALSLKEFFTLFCDCNATINFKANILIDIANGHMKDLYNKVKIAKHLHKDKLCIMVGNIANPNTYKEAYYSGVDYIRVGIGAGNGCITSSNTGIHYPMASLIYDTFLVKKELQIDADVNNKKLPYIVADGGIRNYSDVIKALSLGADYVMIGSLFASLKESAGNIYYNNNGQMCLFLDKNCNIDDDKYTFYKKFYGMASKEGQIDINGYKKTTSEGICKYIKITTTLPKWIENMTDYLCSAMSYVGVKDITDLNPYNTDVVVISKNTQESINK